MVKTKKRKRTTTINLTYVYYFYSCKVAVLQVFNDESIEAQNFCYVSRNNEDGDHSGSLNYCPVYSSETCSITASDSRNKQPIMCDMRQAGKFVESCIYGKLSRR